MKLLNFSLACLLIFCLASCSSTPEESKLEQYTNKLITLYPNFESNEIAEKAINDSIDVFCESFIGKQATLFNDLKFKFVKLIENEEKGTHVAIFQVDFLFTEIESNAAGGEYVTADPKFYVMGTPNNDVAATLNNGDLYKISGTVHAWDKQNLFYEGVHTPSTLNFGTFILNPISIEPAADK